jgi:hypothetical protein
MYDSFVQTILVIMFLPPFDALVRRILHEKVRSRYDMVLRLMKKHCSLKPNDTPKHFLIVESGRLVIAIIISSLIIRLRNVESKK